MHDNNKKSNNLSRVVVSLLVSDECQLVSFSCFYLFSKVIIVP